MNTPTTTESAPRARSTPAIGSTLCGNSTPEKINVRLFDLVRYMRGELLRFDLITMDEYAWLAAEAKLAQGQGSPSPRRLEDYDQLRKRLTELEKSNT